MTLTPVRLVLYWLWLIVLIAHAPAALWLGWPVIVSFHVWLVAPWLIAAAVQQWRGVAADAQASKRRTAEAYGD